jgi:hypothetical protein
MIAEEHQPACILEHLCSHVRPLTKGKANLGVGCQVGGEENCEGGRASKPPLALRNHLGRLLPGPPTTS